MSTKPIDMTTLKAVAAWHRVQAKLEHDQELRQFHLEASKAIWTAIARIEQQKKGEVMARLVTVIETHDKLGKGTEDDPVRRVLQFWSLNGELLMERDDWLEEQRRKPYVPPSICRNCHAAMLQDECACPHCRVPRDKGGDT